MVLIVFKGENTQNGIGGWKIEFAAFIPKIFLKAGDIGLFFPQEVKDFFLLLVAIFLIVGVDAEQLGVVAHHFHAATAIDGGGGFS